MMQKYICTKPFVLSFLLVCLFFSGMAQTRSHITGTVRDDFNKTPLSNASIVLKDTKKGTVTDTAGYFILPVTKQKFILVASALGYESTSIPIDLTSPGSDTTVIFELKKKADAVLDEVVVTANKEKSKTKTTEMGIVRINPDVIKRNIVLFGEADIIKALTLQPGVTTAGEGAGGFSVRGGAADQNLVLVDGAPLFNTSHLLGFFTSVSPDAIQDASLYKGTMPAQYGGRLSSVLNMRVKAGNSERMEYTTGLGPVSAHVMMNGPIIKKKLTFTAGFRAAYPDLLINQLSNSFGASRAFFYDGIIKAEYSFNANNKLSITGYRSFDKFKFDTITRYDWASNLVSLNFNSNISDKMSLKINANYSKFTSGINNLVPSYEFRLQSDIDQKQGKAILSYVFNDKNKLEVGADYMQYGISPGVRTPSSDSSNINSLSIAKEQGREMAGFITDEINFTDKITLQAGLRYTNYNYLAPKTVYYYEDGVPMSKETITDSVAYGGGKSIQSYGGLEPRISLKLGITDNVTVKLGYNRGQQFLHLISNTTAISPVDFWKLSDNYLKGQKGDQYSAGFFASFNKGQYELGIETYYKTIENLVDYKDGATLLLNPYIETALLSAKGRGYGAEFSLSKTEGKFTWQVNYSYSKSEVQVENKFPSEQVDKGGWYPSNSDRPHNVSIIGKVKLQRGWSFNFDFIYTSGRPATYPDGTYSYNTTVVTNYSERNMDRLPAYHRLDAGFSWVSRRYQEQKRYSIWNFSFYNIYLHQNAYSIYFQRDGVQLSSYRLSVIGTIIPSISWTYNF